MSTDATTTAAKESALTRKLRTMSDAAFSGYAIIAAFSTYFCMYAFRKPFASANFEGTVDIGFGSEMDYKIVLIISQVLGYCLSKFIGIKVISEMSGRRRGAAIVALIVIAEAALAGFALTPRPYAALWLFVNGLPLGMIWGLTYGFLEGRRVSEVLGAGLSASYIVASGFVKTVGRWVMDAGVSEEAMPVVVGAIFFPALLLFVYLLSQLPKPTAADEAARTRREPMDHKARMAFLSRYALGLFFLTGLYVFLTAYRDFRDNFAIEIWQAVGYAGKPAVLTTTELVAAVGVLGALALLYLVKSNRKALFWVHVLMMSGTALVGLSTIAFQAGLIGPVVWMTLIGLGLYLAYVPFGCVLFDRLIAAVGIVATAGFMIYVTDAFGYLGSVGVLLYKTFGEPDLSWLDFFVGFTAVTSVVCTASFAVSLVYFMRRTRASELEAAANEAAA